MEKEAETPVFGRYRSLTGIARLPPIILPAITIAVAIYYIWFFIIGGMVLFDIAYYFLLIALVLPLIFFLIPASQKASRDKVPWYDILAALLAFNISIFLFLHARDMIEGMFAVLPPSYVYPLLVILLILVLEAARRQAGIVFALVCLFFTLYPLFAQHMPGLLSGIQFSVKEALTYHAMGSEGIVGIPMRVVGGLLIGYLIFAAALISAGGGQFFTNLAMGLLGHVRGGAAKVAVISSAFFGSVSGSAVANVVTTGSFTIPTMKRLGYSPEYAGATEACASTGGVLMPPIMGATAFLMAEFLGISYSYIVIAAFMPAILYYLALLTQVDAHAAVMGIKGLPKETLPSVRYTLKGGWFFIVAFAILLYLLLFQHMDTRAPFYGALALLALPMLSKASRLHRRDFVAFLEQTGRLLAEIMAPLLGVGLVINSLIITGVAGTLSIQIVELAGGNVYLLLILGAGVAFILGMGMSITAIYVLLALLLAPALVGSGLIPLAVHLFVMYYGMISYITPPVCASCFAASAIARASAMRIGFRAMRIGIAIYFLPFFFVLNPALILRGSPTQILLSLFTCALGVILIGGAIEGYILRLGRVAPWTRALVFIGGVLVAFPQWKTDIIGLCLCALAISIHLITGRTTKVGKLVNPERS